MADFKDQLISVLLPRRWYVNLYSNCIGNIDDLVTFSSRKI